MAFKYEFHKTAFSITILYIPLIYMQYVLDVRIYIEQRICMTKLFFRSAKTREDEITVLVSVIINILARP